MSIKEQDLAKLADAFFENLLIDNCEYGGIGLDSKRPFGNSDVESDILELLEREPEGDDGHDKCWASHQREYASDLYHTHLIPYLRAEWAKRADTSKAEQA